MSDDRPFSAPRKNRFGERTPTRTWALKVIGDWERRGAPGLIGSPAEQIRLAYTILKTAGLKK